MRWIKYYFVLFIRLVLGESQKLSLYYLHHLKETNIHSIL